MIANDGQLAVPIVQETAAQQSRIDPKIFPPQPTFNRHFPQTGGAEEKLVVRIVDQLSSFLGEPLRFTGRPKQKMCVEQQLHNPPPKMASISFFPIWSKSSGTEICPAMKPSLRI